MPEIDIGAWADRVAAGDARALARALSEIENRGPAAAALLERLHERSGNPLFVGITGPPGAGKSALAGALIRAWRARGRRVAVLAIDPSSPFSGGALLGDRIRMQGQISDPGVFIRSMATRGALGGLAAAAADGAAVLGAAGYGVVLIETAGVGQAEVDVAQAAATVLLVLTPGAGDGVQALKAGVMEIADIFVLNKADLPGAGRLEREIRALLSLREESAESAPDVVRTVAISGEGVEELLASIEARAPRSQSSPAYWKRRLGEAPRRGMAEALLAAGLTGEELERAAGEVAAGRMNPYRFAASTLERMGMAGTRIDHIGVAVRSLDEALRFWKGAIGLEAAGRVRVEHEGVEVAMLPAGGPRIELLEATGPESAIARFIERRGEGLHHIALRVANVTAAAERLKSQGYRLVSDEIRRGAGGHPYVFIHPKSTGGVLLELVEDETPRSNE